MQRSAIERNKKPIGSLDIPDDFTRYYLSKKDRQMRFCNAKDPIYHIFASIENRPLKELFKGFIKESIKDSQKFLQKLVA
ncbi:hypothetical protein J6O48_07180 [bacterium]|nr:hypothetical protein [bacterium]